MKNVIHTQEQDTRFGIITYETSLISGRICEHGNDAYNFINIGQTLRPIVQRCPKCGNTVVIETLIVGMK